MHRIWDSNSPSCSLQGLYKGYLANLVRNSIISATELVSYDQAKQTLLEQG